MTAAMIEDPEYFRERAAKARLYARHTANEVVRASLIEIAASYDEIARRRPIRRRAPRDWTAGTGVASASPAVASAGAASADAVSSTGISTDASDSYGPISATTASPSPRTSMARSCFSVRAR